MSSEPPPAAVARYSPWLMGWFQWYLRGYIPKHFHALALAREPRPNVAPDQPLLVYLNHAAWWDPLVALVVADKIFPHHKVYAPFDAEAIARYPLFERLGFFGVDQSSRQGAADFLRTASAALASHGGSLWLTPEGRFCDPRDRQATLEPGLAHLATKLAGESQQALIVPMAIEYPFWEERFPEALVKFGPAIRVADYRAYDKQQWQTLLESTLRQAQDELTELSVDRASDAFELVLSGRRGVGGVYEWFRRATSFFTGRRYQSSHGKKLQA